ncbi:testis-specific Y-encoded protein 2-like [Mesoplodon densirostris]|uniref:testis-specific Y-encoded protein 2-like n=1 Tax=Mesoplodon densirostris TaxID=48708 RepID=UPI0028DD3C10|nr:testis-specific Y-encoded protein 2-like [Mesoplodon densirostris]
MGSSGLGVALSSFLPPGHACLVSKFPVHAFQASSPRRLQGTIQSAAKPQSQVHMGSEAGPGEGGTAWGPGVILGVGGGPQEAGARGSSGVVREVGRVLALADAWGEEAAIFSGDVVQQGAALLEGEVACIGELFWLPVEDMMEEVEVVAEEQQHEEQEERKHEQGQEEPGPGPTITGSLLEVLEAMQLQLEPLNRRCSRTFSPLMLTTLWRRKPYLEHRSTIMQSIPGFWVKVFVNHPQMSATMSAQDKDVLSYMTNLKEEELRYTSDCRKIMLFFRNNPNFQNEVVVKEYLIHVTGYRASHSTPIQWHHRFEREAYSRRHHNSSLNFFSWFSDHRCAGSSRIAESPTGSSARTCGPIPCATTRGRKAPSGQVTERRTGG